MTLDIIALLRGIKKVTVESVRKMDIDGTSVVRFIDVHLLRLLIPLPRSTQ